MGSGRAIEQVNEVSSAVAVAPEADSQAAQKELLEAKQRESETGIRVAALEAEVEQGRATKQEMQILLEDTAQRLQVCLLLHTLFWVRASMNQAPATSLRESSAIGVSGGLQDRPLECLRNLKPCRSREVGGRLRPRSMKIVSGRSASCVKRMSPGAATLRVCFGSAEERVDVQAVQEVVARSHGIFPGSHERQGGNQSCTE